MGKLVTTGITFGIILVSLLATKAWSQAAAPAVGGCPPNSTKDGGTCVVRPGHQIYYAGQNNRGNCPMGWKSWSDYCYK